MKLSEGNREKHRVARSIGFSWIGDWSKPMKLPYDWVFIHINQRSFFGVPRQVPGALEWCHNQFIPRQVYYDAAQEFANLNGLFFFEAKQLENKAENCETNRTWWGLWWMTQCNLCLRNSRQLLGGDISSAERKQDIYHVYTYIQLYTQYMSNQCSIGFVVGMNDRPQNLVIWVVRPPAPARQTSAVADINAAGLSLATAHVKGCKAFWGRRNHHWVPSPIKKEEIMGFLPILNRYEMGCPSGKTCVYIYIIRIFLGWKSSLFANKGENHSTPVCTPFVCLY